MIPNPRRLPRLLGLAAVLLVVTALPARSQEPIPGEGTPAPTPTPTGTPTGTEGMQEPVEDMGMFQPGEGLEAAISGIDYRLGPGDILAVSIWGPRNMTFRLPITLEGKLLIPDVGEVRVDGLMLKDGKDRIKETILRHYRNVDVTVTLVDLRRFQVHVLGEVRAPGTYIATAVDRVSVAIARARGFKDDASTRLIRVENGDTLRAVADVAAFLTGGDLSRNPRLRDGDQIYVPYLKDQFQARGEVNHPGTIEYVNGDRLSDAIPLIGGFTANAFLDTLEVARFVGEDPDPFRFKVVNGGGLVATRPEDAPNLPQALDLFTPPATALPVGKAPVYTDFLLHPNDIVLVRQIPESRLRRLVDVEGEVHYPGLYPIEEGKSRISDLVRWAGGVTEDALLLEGKLIRRGDVLLEDREFERLKKVPVADMREEEYQYFKMRSRETPGQMVVDFERALRTPGSADDLLLKRGDTVVIPTRKNYVNVLGMVTRPGNVVYHPTLSFKEYIGAAGGFAENADRGKTRVIKARGGAWVSPGRVEGFEPGDVIFVPEKGQHEFWKMFRDGLTVTAQILTIYLVVDRALQ